MSNLIERGAREVWPPGSAFATEQFRRAAAFLLREMSADAKCLDELDAYLFIGSFAREHGISTVLPVSDRDSVKNMAEQE